MFKNALLYRIVHWDPPALADLSERLAASRFVECGALNADRPDGQVVPWDEIRFPFDPALRERSGLADVWIERTADGGREIEERYACSANGLFEVTVSVPNEGFSRTYRIGRPSGAAHQETSSRRAT